jgi:hypothetical protein
VLDALPPIAHRPHCLGGTLEIDVRLVEQDDVPM